MFTHSFFNTVPMTSSKRSKYSVKRKLKNEASRFYISDKNTRPNQTIQNSHVKFCCDACCSTLIFLNTNSQVKFCCDAFCTTLIF